MSEEKKIRYTVKMLAAYMNQSVAELARNAGIDVYHLQQVASGRLKLNADDLVKLRDYTGIDVSDIQL